MTARAQRNAVPFVARLRHAGRRPSWRSKLLIRVGLINRFIVPLPSQIARGFERVIVEEDIAHRFLVTAREVAVGDRAARVVRHRHRRPALSRAAAARATETWVAALASAPTVLMYPLFLVIFGRSAKTIIMMGFVAGLPAVILKTIEGLAGTRRVLINVGRSFKLIRNAAVLEDPVSRPRCRPSSSACGSA